MSLNFFFFPKRLALTSHSVQYFKAARGILDIAMCRDLNGLQVGRPSFGFLIF